MTTTILDRDALHDVLPHRGCNILIDELRLDREAGDAESSFIVPVDDPHGRRLFARDDGQGGQCWMESFLGEAVALTGVPLLADEMQAGQVSVFSMISRVAFFRAAPLDQVVNARARITRRRGAFTQFACTVDVDGERVMDAEVLSGVATLAEVTAGDTKPLLGAIGEPVVAPGFKDARLHFISGVRQLDREARRLQASYVYPDHHPLVPGHFPDGAVMMGVTQWQAVADAAWLLRQELGIEGGILVDGRITREDGSEVLDVRELEVAPGPGGIPCLRGSKRCAFRDVVRPGDGIVIEVTAR